MGVLSDRRFRWLAVALVAVLVASLLVVVVGSVAVASTFLALLAGEAGLLALLGVAAPAALAVTGLGTAAVVLGSWMAVRAVRVAEAPRSDRLAARAERLERYFPPLRALGLSDVVTPTLADRREALKERYARGELTEREFEREVARLLDEDDEAHPGALEDIEHRLAEDDLADGRADRVDSGDERPAEERSIDDRTAERSGERSSAEPTGERERY